MNDMMDLGEASEGESVQVGLVTEDDAGRVRPAPCVVPGYRVKQAKARDGNLLEQGERALAEQLAVVVNDRDEHLDLEHVSSVRTSEAPSRAGHRGLMRGL